jgi:hypothetical protein
VGRLPARELAEWAAFERVEGPFLHQRLDYATAMICYVLASVNSDGKRRYRVEDFLPQWDGSVDNADLIIQKMKGLEALYGNDRRSRR